MLRICKVPTLPCLKFRQLPLTVASSDADTEADTNRDTDTDTFTCAMWPLARFVAERVIIYLLFTHTRTKGYLNICVCLHSFHIYTHTFFLFIYLTQLIKIVGVLLRHFCCLHFILAALVDDIFTTCAHFRKIFFIVSTIYN